MRRLLFLSLIVSTNIFTASIWGSAFQVPAALESSEQVALYGEQLFLLASNPDISFAEKMAIAIQDPPIRCKQMSISDFESYHFNRTLLFAELYDIKSASVTEPTLEETILLLNSYLDSYADFSSAHMSINEALAAHKITIHTKRYALCNKYLGMIRPSEEIPHYRWLIESGEIIVDFCSKNDEMKQEDKNKAQEGLFHSYCTVAQVVSADQTAEIFTNAQECLENLRDTTNYNQLRKTLEQTKKLANVNRAVRSSKGMSKGIGRRIDKIQEKHYLETLETLDPRKKGIPEEIATQYFRLRSNLVDMNNQEIVHAVKAIENYVSINSEAGTNLHEIYRKIMDSIITNKDDTVLQNFPKIIIAFMKDNDLEGALARTTVMKQLTLKKEFIRYCTHAYLLEVIIKNLQGDCDPYLELLKEADDIKATEKQKEAARHAVRVGEIKTALAVREAEAAKKTKGQKKKESAKRKSCCSSFGRKFTCFSRYGDS